MKCANMEETKNFNYNKTMKNEEEIKQIALKISEIEKSNEISNSDKYKLTEQLTMDLSLEDIIMLDIYIQEILSLKE